MTTLVSAGPHLSWPKEIDGLLVPPGKAYTQLTDHMIPGYPLRSEPVQEKWFQVKTSIHISLVGFFGWIYFKYSRWTNVFVTFD